MFHQKTSVHLPSKLSVLRKRILARIFFPSFFFWNIHIYRNKETRKAGGPCTIEDLRRAQRINKSKNGKREKELGRSHGERELIMFSLTRNIDPLWSSKTPKILSRQLNHMTKKGLERKTLASKSPEKAQNTLPKIATNYLTSIFLRHQLSNSSP